MKTNKKYEEEKMPVLEPIQQKCLKNFLIRCCYYYYVKADPIISDREFDGELKRLQRLEEETGVACPDSPTQMIWGDRDEQYPEWCKDDLNLPLGVQRANMKQEEDNV
jgi:hypothetical protein